MQFGESGALVSVRCTALSASRAMSTQGAASLVRSRRGSVTGLAARRLPDEVEAVLRLVNMVAISRRPISQGMLCASR